MATSVSLRQQAIVPVAAIAFFVCGWCVDAANAAEPLPRYRLTPGQVINYRITSPAVEWQSIDPNVAKDGKLTEAASTTDWTITVVRQNDDGGWRLLASGRWQRDSADTTEVSSDGYLDLSPDGRISGAETIIPGVWDVGVLFPPLPPDERSLASGWEAHSPIDNTLRKLSAAAEPEGSSSATCRLREVDESLLNSVVERTEAREYTFDREQGLVHSGSVRIDQRLPKLSGRIVQSLELLGVRDLEANEAAQLSDDMDEYIAADRKYRELVDRALHQDYRNAAAVLSEAHSLLEGLPARLALPITKGMAEDKLKTHDLMQKSRLREADSFATLAGKPAPDWRTTDLDGKPHALSDYRGKVVVLDFWYRGCGWCVRAMPQIKQLVEEFQEQDVVVLGLNCDENEADARFVIDKAGLNYLTLKDPKQRIRAAYLAGYPSTVVIDRAGLVRHFHIGYSPEMREELAKVIRGLLVDGPQ